MSSTTKKRQMSSGDRAMAAAAGVESRFCTPEAIETATVNT
jgi:hypothetical protein